MFEMRYTVIDGRGTVSFVGPCHALKMLVAGCARMPDDLATLLGHVRTLDERFADFVASALAVFDEHHDGTAVAAVPSQPDADPTTSLAARPVFRVTDSASRQASLQPRRAGVVLFNLPERRIVQIHNTYAAIERSGRGRLRRDGQPIARFYYYDLPREWRIVP